MRVHFCACLLANVVASLHVYMQGPQASGVKGVQVLGESGEDTHILGCRQRLLLLGRLLWCTWAYAWKPTYTLLKYIHKQHLKNVLHTLHSHGLKGSHWGRRLYLLRGKTDCIWKMKGEGMQAHVYE